jgi:predicted amidophosphoribosyltransferase
MIYKVMMNETAMDVVNGYDKVYDTKTNLEEAQRIAYEIQKIGKAIAAWVVPVITGRRQHRQPRYNQSTEMMLQAGLPVEVAIEEAAEFNHAMQTWSADLNVNVLDV